MRSKEKKVNVVIKRILISIVDAKLQQRKIDLPRMACNSRRLRFDLSVKTKILKIKFSLDRQ